MQYLGIDLSKQKFDVALIVDEKDPANIKRKVFSNDTEGFGKLMIWLSKRATEPVHAAMEATGAYWEALATYLRQEGVTVSVVNPAVIRKEADSWSVRNKTDRVDASVIARFCLAKRPRAWTPPSNELRELRDMARHLECLEAEKRQNENRLVSGVSSDAVRESLEGVIAFLEEEIRKLEKRISNHIKGHPCLKKDRDLLMSIPGIGEKTAAVILGELQDVSNYSCAKQVVAYAGLSPRLALSGTLKGRSRMCKFGNSRLRRALFFPAIVASSRNALVSSLYERMLLSGKCKMSAIGACMRKLLAIAYGVLKSGSPFQEPA